MAYKYVDWSTVKCRYWLAILYEESVKLDYIDFLQSLGIKFALSPIHDHDLKDTEATPDERLDRDPADPSPLVWNDSAVPDHTDHPIYKKPHRHCIFCKNGPTTQKVINDMICKPLNLTIPVPCMSVIGSYEYFTHKNNPEKAQYDPKLIIRGNGFKALDFVGISRDERRYITDWLEDYIILNKLYTYSELIDQLRLNGYFIEVDVARQSSHIKEYLSSRDASRKALMTEDEYRKVLASYSFTNQKRMEALRQIDERFNFYTDGTQL